VLYTYTVKLYIVYCTAIPNTARTYLLVLVPEYKLLSVYMHPEYNAMNTMFMPVCFRWGPCYPVL